MAHTIGPVFVPLLVRACPACMGIHIVFKGHPGTGTGTLGWWQCLDCNKRWKDPPPKDRPKRGVYAT